MRYCPKCGCVITVNELEKYCPYCNWYAEREATGSEENLPPIPLSFTFFSQSSLPAKNESNLTENIFPPGE